jgi:Tetracyclin repressor-like, C-terminal domain
MHRDPELAAAVREQVIQAKREVSAPSSPGQPPGDVPAMTGGALLAEISSAVLFSRLLVTGEPLDDAFTQHLVDAVLLPALGRPSP